MIASQLRIPSLPTTDRRWYTPNLWDNETGRRSPLVKEGKSYSHATVCAGLRRSAVGFMPVPSPFFLLLEQ